MRVLKIAALILITPMAAWAGTRADHWSGIDAGFGEPYPSYAGINLGFNIGDDARLSAGLGTLGRWTSYAGDAKFFATDAQWSPYIGVGLTYITGNAGQYLWWNLDFNNAFVPFLELGMDFQSDIGVHVTFNLAGSAPNGQIVVFPGIVIGWYF